MMTVLWVDWFCIFSRNGGIHTSIMAMVPDSPGFMSAAREGTGIVRPSSSML